MFLQRCEKRFVGVPFGGPKRGAVKGTPKGGTKRGAPQGGRHKGGATRGAPKEGPQMVASKRGAQKTGPKKWGRQKGAPKGGQKKGALFASPYWGPFNAWQSMISWVYFLYVQKYFILIRRGGGRDLFIMYEGGGEGTFDCGHIQSLRQLHLLDVNFTHPENHQYKYVFDK